MGASAPRPPEATRPRSRAEPRAAHVAARGGAEQAGVIAGELRHALIPDRMGGMADGGRLSQHQAAGLYQAQLLLELQR